VNDSKKAIDFYKKAFAAKETFAPMMHEGKVMHARVVIGDSELMLTDEMWISKSPLTLGDSPVVLYLKVDDVDSVFKRAVEAGAKVVMPPADMFWGDRYSRVTDPFGHHWGIGTTIKNLSREEMEKGKEKAMAEMSKSKDECAVKPA